MEEKEERKTKKKKKRGREREREKKKKKDEECLWKSLKRRRKSIFQECSLRGG